MGCKKSCLRNKVLTFGIKKLKIKVDKGDPHKWLASNYYLKNNHRPPRQSGYFFILLNTLFNSFDKLTTYTIDTFWLWQQDCDSLCSLYKFDFATQTSHMFAFVEYHLSNLRPSGENCRPFPVLSFLSIFSIFSISSYYKAFGILLQKNFYKFYQFSLFFLHLTSLWHPYYSE